MRQRTGKNTCILCKSATPIQNSHIIPAFIVRWLKKASAVNHLRWSQNNNKPEQDGWKADYLCSACEIELSKVENPFKVQIFDKVVARLPGSFPYDSSFGVATLSMFFRHLQFVQDAGHEVGNPRIDGLIEELRVRLACCLQGKADFGHLYALPLDFDVQAALACPGINQYLLTLDGWWFDWNIPSHDPFYIGSIKLPLLQLLFSEHPLEDICVSSNHRDELLALNIKESGSLAIPCKSGVIEKLVQEDYVNRSKSLRESMETLSEKQVAKVKKEIQNHDDPYSTIFHEASLADGCKPSE